MELKADTEEKEFWWSKEFLQNCFFYLHGGNGVEGGHGGMEKQVGLKSYPETCAVLTALQVMCGW
jgi:hypothetical protein